MPHHREQRASWRLVFGIIRIKTGGRKREGVNKKFTEVMSGLVSEGVGVDLD